MGISWIESYNMPVWQRRWLIKRLNKEIKDSNGETKAPQHNTPNTREMQGRQRSQVPARLRRFT
jgi:hypothetical protein